MGAYDVGHVALTVHFSLDVPTKHKWFVASSWWRVSLKGRVARFGAGQAWTLTLPSKDMLRTVFGRIRVQETNPRYVAILLGQDRRYATRMILHNVNYPHDNNMDSGKFSLFGRYV